MTGRWARIIPGFDNPPSESEQRAERFAADCKGYYGDDQKPSSEKPQSDTPRTDVHAGRAGLAPEDQIVVDAELSRQLERELAAERRQYAQCADALNRALQSASGAVAWIATNELGSVLHLAKADGWNVEVVAVDKRNT